MTYEQWVIEHNSDSQLLRECWETAQADIKERLAQKLGNDNGYVQRRFYPHLVDVLKEV
jgi:hypothetical protein